MYNHKKLSLFPALHEAENYHGTTGWRGILKLNYLLPARAVNHANWFAFWLFGIKEKQDKLLLNEILTHTNSSFARWAIGAVLNWKRTTIPEHLIRIHGDKDKVLRIIHFKPTYLIRGAGHFMIANRADEISGILRLKTGLQYQV